VETETPDGSLDGMVVANLATHFELTSWVGPQVERPLLAETAGGYQHRAVRGDRVAQPDGPDDAVRRPRT